MKKNYGSRSHARNRRGSSHFYQPHVTGSCLFCKGDVGETSDQHTRNQCPLFKSLKRMTTSFSYIDVQLKSNDEVGYAAAGILPWRRLCGEQVEFLLAREYRDNRGGDFLNFLGGKRHKKETNAVCCAVDKVDIETGQQLSRATIAKMRDACPLVCWSSDSKYVLFLYEFVSDDDREVDVQCAGIGRSKRLEWATRDMLLDPRWTRSNFHDFARDMLHQLTSCNIMTHLEKLFDVAVGTETSEPQENPTGKNPAEVADHFDIVGAIRSSLLNVQPDHPSLPPPLNPTFHQLRNAFQALPKPDLKKLKLRFHPDRLVVRALGRRPNEEDSALCTCVMQILNGLADVNGEKDVMQSLKEASASRRNLLKQDQVSDETKALRVMLESLKM